jgi:CelD/BcsL family acetyltransferase involved in cellulose biosynthesis
VERTLQIDLIEDADTLMTLRDEWDRLLAESPADGMFLTWEWLSTWWRHLSRDRRLFLLAVRSDGELAALAPLAVRLPGLHSALPFPYLEFLGSGSVGSDYLDLIMRRGRERESLALLAERLAREKLLLELDQVRTGTAAVFDLARLLSRRGWRAARETINECRFITLAGHSWDSYLGSLGRAHRQNFRRRLRTLERSFKVRWEVVRAEDGRAQALERLFVLHGARWRERGVSNAFHTPAHVAFHQEVTRLACERGWLRLCLLELDGTPAAALYGFRYRDVFYFYQSGFDPAFSRHSVGLVTMGLAIKSAIEEGAREFDLLQGVEGYKGLWARQERELSRVEIYPPLLRGSVFRGAVGLRRGAKRAVRSVLSQRLFERIVTRLQNRDSE